MVNYAKRTLHGTAYIFVISLFAAFIGYLLRLALARGLTQYDYGMFYAVFSLFGFVAIFKELGLNQAVAKFIPEYLHKKDYSGIKSVILSSFFLQMIFSAVLTAVAILFSDSIAKYFFHTQAASIVIKLLAIMFLLMPLENFFRYSFQGFQKMLYFAGVEFLRMLAILAIIILLLKNNMGVLAPSIAYIAAYIIVPIICIFFFLRMFPQFLKVKSNITSDSIKKLIRFGIPVTVGIFAYTIMTYSDTIILTYFRSMNEVALYQVASPTSKLILYLGFAIAAVFLPLSSELWAKGEKDKLRIGTELIYRYALILVMPLALLMVMFPELILKIFFGPGYTGGAIPMQILAIGSIMYTIGHINGNLLSGIGKPEKNMKIIIYASLFNIVTNIIFIPFYGAIGAASTTFASYLIILIFTSYEVKKHIRIKAPLMKWAKNIAAGAVFLAVIYFTKMYLEMGVWAEIAISVAASSAAYVLLLFAMKIVSKKDIDFIRYSIGKSKQIKEKA